LKRCIWLSNSLQQSVELSLPLERVEFIAPPHMRVVDKDLRHRRPTAGTPRHFPAFRDIRNNIDFAVLDSLLLKQALRSGAVRAEQTRIDLNFGH
jgi:hypothetical protein